MVPDVPLWLKISHKNSSISSRDIADLFGYSNVSSVTNAVRKGDLPKPDILIRCGEYKNERFFWRPASILQEIARRRSKSHP